MLEKGQLGRYELTERIAVGGMAEVFLARVHGVEGFQRPLVIKRMLPQLTESRDAIEMFLDEARLGAKLSHPNIVQVLDLGEADGHYFMAMEYIDGPDLASLLSQVLQGHRFPLTWPSPPLAPRHHPPNPPPQPQPQPQPHP